MMIPVIDVVNDKTVTINPSALQELLENNFTAPHIKRVIFNLKTFDSKAERDANGSLIIDENTNKPKRVQVACKPVLATTIEFIDNTKCSVKNSLNDTVDTEYFTLEDGSKVVVATEQAKELGVVYCILKRFIGKPDENGNIIGDGFGRILRDIVKNAYDEDLEAAKNKVKKAASKKRHEETIKNAKPKTKNPSMLETVQKLAQQVETLTKSIEKIQANVA